MSSNSERAARGGAVAQAVSSREPAITARGIRCVMRASYQPALAATKLFRTAETPQRCLAATIAAVSAIGVSPCPSALERVPAVDGDHRAGHEVGGRAGQEHRHTAHVVDHAPAPDRGPAQDRIM